MSAGLNPIQIENTKRGSFVPTRGSRERRKPIRRSADPPMGENYLRECQWAPAVEFEIPQDWLSGVYLGKLTALASGIQSYVIFVFIKMDRLSHKATWFARRLCLDPVNPDVAARFFALAPLRLCFGATTEQPRHEACSLRECSTCFKRWPGVEGCSWTAESSLPAAAAALPTPGPRAGAAPPACRLVGPKRSCSLR